MKTTQNVRHICNNMNVPEDECETIDITPTWTFAMQVYIDVLKNSDNASAIQAAEDDLMKLARSVDARSAA